MHEHAMWHESTSHVYVVTSKKSIILFNFKSSRQIHAEIGFKIHVKASKIARHVYYTQSNTFKYLCVSFFVSACPQIHSYKIIAIFQKFNQCDFRFFAFFQLTDNTKIQIIATIHIISPVMLNFVFHTNYPHHCVGDYNKL